MHYYRMRLQTLFAGLAIAASLAACAAGNSASSSGTEVAASAATRSGSSSSTEQFIAYVVSIPLAEGKRQYRLMISDIYGADQHVVTSTREPIMSPAWSPDMKRLAYAAYDHGHSGIYAQTLANGTLQKLVSLPGVNGAPAWSPDGRFLAFAGSDESKNCDIYIYEFATSQIRRLTSNPAIDTEPSFAPDSQSLIFMSDRSGHPKIYSVPVAGGVETLIAAGENSQSPKYSPDGKSIAFVNKTEKGMQIAMLTLATQAVQILTSGTLDDEPSFSPDSASIMYLSHANPVKGDITIVSVDGSKSRGVPSSLDITSAAWSPK